MVVRNRLITGRLTLNYKGNTCPFKVDDIGEQIESPIVDDMGTHYFSGDGYIESMTIANVEDYGFPGEPFIEISVLYYPDTETE